MPNEEFILPGTAEEQAIIDGRIIDEALKLADHFPGSQADCMTHAELGNAALCYVKAAALQDAAALYSAPPSPPDWPLSPAAWTATADPRDNYAKAAAFLWLEMIRLERAACAQEGGDA